MPIRLQGTPIVPVCVVLVFMAVFALPHEVTADEPGWRPIGTEGPPPRHSPGMVYDSARNVVVMFGGITGREREGILYGDTWEWDGVEWRQAAGSGPEGRSRSAMVYDEAAHRIILFGGRSQDGAALGDTWAWDGKEWTRLDENTEFARSRHGMVYHRKRGTIVAHGVSFNGRNEMIEWDGTKWKRIDTAVLSSRIYYGLVYHEQRNSIIMFGGWDGNNPTAETWEFQF